MSYSVDDLVGVLGRLVESGVKFVVVGDTCVQLALKKRALSGDVDLFVEEPSVFVEEEFYRGLAERFGWEYGLTEIGTPRIIARIGDREIVLEFYENFMDINIPSEILEKSRSLTISGVRIKVLYPEQYFVLKARQGVDLDKLSKYLKELKRIDHKLLENTIKYFPVEEQQLIRERLGSIGLHI